MKIKIQLKDPDGVCDSIMGTARDTVAEMAEISDDEREELAERRSIIIRNQCKPWIKYDEYVTIEIDTDAGTASVVKCE